MKKILSCALIMSMLSTMGAMCFANEVQEEVNVVEDVVSQVESTEELNEVVEAIKAEIENNDQLKEELEALSKDVKEEENGTWFAIKSWLREKALNPVLKTADILATESVLALCSAVISIPFLYYLKGTYSWAAFGGSFLAFLAWRTLFKVI